MVTNAAAKRLLLIDDVAAMVGVSKNTVRRWWRNGDIPEPLRCGRRAIRWRADDIDKWLALGCPGRAAAEGKQRATIA